MNSKRKTERITDDESALINLPEMAVRYNYEPPHLAPGYLSPTEYRVSKGLQTFIDMQDYMSIHDMPGCVIVRSSAEKHCEGRA